MGLEEDSISTYQNEAAENFSSHLIMLMNLSDANIKQFEGRRKGGIKNANI